MSYIGHSHPSINILLKTCKKVLLGGADTFAYHDRHFLVTEKVFFKNKSHSTPEYNESSIIAKSSFTDSNMNGRVKSDGSSLGEDDDIATVEETFEEAETSSGLANTSPQSMRGSSPLANPLNVSIVNR